MCMHSHFQPLLGIDLKWWLHECTTADHVIFLSDEDFRERKGIGRKGSADHKLGMWNCGQLFAEQNTMPARWTGAQPPRPSSSPTKMLQRKVVCEYVCVCSSMSLFLPPLPSPSHTRTLRHKRTIELPPVQLFKKEARGQATKGENTLSAEPHDAPRLYENDINMFSFLSALARLTDKSRCWQLFNGRVEYLTPFNCSRTHAHTDHCPPFTQHIKCFLLSFSDRSRDSAPHSIRRLQFRPGASLIHPDVSPASRRTVAL